MRKQESHIFVDESISIKAYYAGHVLGAAMFEVRVGSESIVYTGDYNMTPDRHLGAAQIKPGICPDLLITESTYATTIRDSKRARERDFLKKVHDCVNRGGKVLIPVFALGRAQELCILLESYWERMDLKVPIYFSRGLAEKATNYYRLFINWTNEKIKRTFVHRNMFDFKHVLPFDHQNADQPGAMVLFATPGMLHSGNSLKVFKKWAPDDKNMVIMPGYCVAGTVGHKVIKGAKRIEIEGNMVPINLSVEYMSFSAHADAKGIMQLIKTAQPKHVMLVHGEDIKMEFLKSKIEKEFGVEVFKPANGETVRIPTQPTITLDVSRDLIKRSIEADPNPSKRHCPFHASLVVKKNNFQAAETKVLDPEKAASHLGLPSHSLCFSDKLSVVKKNKREELVPWLASLLQESSLGLAVKEKDGCVEVGSGVVLTPAKEKSAVSVTVDYDWSQEPVGKKVCDFLKTVR